MKVVEAEFGGHLIFDTPIISIKIEFEQNCSTLTMFANIEDKKQKIEGLLIYMEHIKREIKRLEREEE